MSELDKIYSTEEAAERLRLSRRELIKFARKYGLCSRVGKRYLFSEADLLGIWGALREPAKERRPATVRSYLSEPPIEEMHWLFPPRVLVDCREFGVLRILGKHKQACTHKQLDRAGPRTVEKLIRLGLAVEINRDAEENPRIYITREGRDQIAIVDRWIKLRLKHGMAPGKWGRNANE